MRQVAVFCLAVLCLVNVSYARGRYARSYTRTSVSVSTSAINMPIDESPVCDHEQRLISAVNAVRAAHGLAALVVDTTLLGTARQHCSWMARCRSMVHTSRPVAENIAMGQTDVDAVMRSWMGSKGHRANILNPHHTRIGVSCQKTSDGRTVKFWCQQFK